MTLGLLDVVGIFLAVLLANVVGALISDLLQPIIMARVLGPAPAAGPDLGGSEDGPITPPESGGAEFDVEQEG